LRSRPRPGLPLVRLPSPSEFLSPTGSAFVAPGAPPLAVSTGLGSFPSCGLPGRKVPRDPLVEFGSPSEFDRLHAARSPSPPRPPSSEEDGDRCVSRVRDPPLLVLAPTNTTTPGAPFAALRRDAARWARDCRSLAGAVLRVLAPLDGFWLHFATQRAPRGTRRRSRRPDAWRPCSMPLAFLESPFRAFPSRGAVPAFAGPCFRAGSRSTAAWRDVLERFATAFPAAPTPCLGSPSRVHRTPEP